MHGIRVSLDIGRVITGLFHVEETTGTMEFHWAVGAVVSFDDDLE